VLQNCYTCYAGKVFESASFEYRKILGFGVFRPIKRQGNDFDMSVQNPEEGGHQYLQKMRV